MQRTLDLLALLDGKDILQVKDRLLPVGVLGVGARGEANGLVAGGELDVEPGDERVDEIVAPRGQLEGAAEGEIGGLDFVEVEG